MEKDNNNNLDNNNTQRTSNVVEHPIFKQRWAECIRKIEINERWFSRKDNDQ